MPPTPPTHPHSQHYAHTQTLIFADLLLLRCLGPSGCPSTGEGAQLHLRLPTCSSPLARRLEHTGPPHSPSQALLLTYHTHTNTHTSSDTMITFSNNNIAVSSLIAECNVIITPQIKGYPEKGLQRRKNTSHTHTQTSWFSCDLQLLSGYCRWLQISYSIRNASNSSAAFRVSLDSE